MEDSGPRCNSIMNDLHKIQTKEINHTTRHYMNRRELESEQPIHVAVCSQPFSFSRPQCSVAIERREVASTLQEETLKRRGMEMWE